MNRKTCVAVAVSGGSSIMFGGVFVFILRNARVALAVAIVAAGVSAASIIGWITAPVA